MTFSLKSLLIITVLVSSAALATPITFAPPDKSASDRHFIRCKNLVNHHCLKEHCSQPITQKCRKLCQREGDACTEDGKVFLTDPAH